MGSIQPHHIHYLEKIFIHMYNHRCLCEPDTDLYMAVKWGNVARSKLRKLWNEQQRIWTQILSIKGLMFSVLTTNLLTSLNGFYTTILLL